MLLGGREEMPVKFYVLVYSTLAQSRGGRRSHFSQHTLGLAVLQELIPGRRRPRPTSLFQF
jgi:hypothetical protein